MSGLGISKKTLKGPYSTMLVVVVEIQKIHIFIKNLKSSSPNENCKIYREIIKNIF